jgi:hypothetical protein
MVHAADLVGSWPGAGGWAGGTGSRRLYGAAGSIGKQFFFEKKNQKTFANCVHHARKWADLVPP